MINILIANFIFKVGPLVNGANVQTDQEEISFVCICGRKIKILNELFIHIADQHFGSEEIDFVCGFENCEKSDKVPINSVRRHYYRVHHANLFTAGEVFPLLSSKSFLKQFYELEHVSAEIPDVDVPSLDLCSYNQQQLSPENESEVRDVFVNELGKLAFENIYANPVCKTSMYDFFSKLTNIYYSLNASQEEIYFAKEVFKNEHRTKKFFAEKFQILKVIEGDLQNVDFYYLDPKVFFDHLFSNPQVVSSLELFAPKKTYFDSFLDGSRIKNNQNFVHLSLYVDDFDPLIKSVYTGRSVHKVTGIYLRVMNLSPHIFSKRDLVFPYAVFSCANTLENKHSAYEFASNILKKFVTKEFSAGGMALKFKISICCADNLAAHELLGLSTPASSHPCRFCSEKSDSIQENFEPLKQIYRTPENILSNLKTFIALKSEFSNMNHCDGVKEAPMFKNFPELNDPFNFPSCISHDVFEKIIPDTLFSSMLRLKHERLIDMNLCIDKLMKFDLSSADRENAFLVTTTRFSGSSGQLRTLMRLFKFILKSNIPFENDLCKGILLIHDIFLMINSPVFYKSWAPKFKKQIKELIKFIRVDLNLSIYPKLHYLIHYPEQINLFGPLKNLSTDIFESVHKRFKAHLLPSSNHKNIIKTMFFGVSCELSYKLKFPQDFDKPIPSKNTNPFSVDKLPDKCQNKFNSNTLKAYRFVNYGSFVFKKNFFIAKKAEQKVYIFYKIIEIFSDEDENYFLQVSSEKFSYSAISGCYEYIGPAKCDQEVLTLFDAWHNPIEPYLDGNKFILIPHFYYFEQTC